MGKKKKNGFQKKTEEARKKRLHLWRARNDVGQQARQKGRSSRKARKCWNAGTKKRVKGASPRVSSSTVSGP